LWILGASAGWAVGSGDGDLGWGSVLLAEDLEAGRETVGAVNEQGVPIVSGEESEELAVPRQEKAVSFRASNPITLHG
jgi:hypothetical protein